MWERVALVLSVVPTFECSLPNVTICDVSKTIEFPQLQYIDKVVDVLVVQVLLITVPGRGEDS